MGAPVATGDLVDEEGGRDDAGVDTHTIVRLGDNGSMTKKSTSKVWQAGHQEADRRSPRTRENDNHLTKLTH